MPDKKSPGEKKSEEKPSGGKKSLFLNVGVCVALLGIGIVVGGKMSGGAAAAPAAGEAVVEAEEEIVPESEEIGQVVDLDPVNVNLADGRYLRVAVALGLEHPPGGHGEEFNGAPASDVVLATFTGRTVDELSTPEGRNAAREEIAHGLVHFYGEEVVSLYFTEFVMQ